MRGYFGIGVQRLSKPMNAGNLFRSAHAFGASFAFTIDSDLPLRGAGSDTSNAWRSEERRVGKECRSRWSPDH